MPAPPDMQRPVTTGWRDSAIRNYPLGDLESALREFRQPVFVALPEGAHDWPSRRDAYAPPLHPSDLGDPAFRAAHGVRYAYCTGAMANGIGSEELIEAMGNAGMMGFFGAAGLSPARIEAALQRLSASMAGKAWGCNLINSPGDPLWQEAVADLCLKYHVPCVEASAYISLSLPLVKYRVAGIRQEANGNVVAPNRVMAKLSRAEVARRFLSPPPEKMLKHLVESGQISAQQAEWAQRIPMADDITVEADSGGHTDHRPAINAFPAILTLRDQLQAEFAYPVAPRIGLAGGIGTPAAVAATFHMGAAYVVTGSINQACVESGSSNLVRGMLAGASQTDVGQAPAADMFEMGVTVQVLTKGTRFTTRGGKLFQLFKQYDSSDDIPAEERQKIEAEIFRAPLDDIWRQTHAFFSERDPSQIEKAEAKPRHKMALIFRWYLGQSSRWANAGVEDRQEDYQVWCGPAMGAFNEWVAGTALEPVEARKAVTVALNLMASACVVQRASMLRMQGVDLPPGITNPRPIAAHALQAVLQ